MPVIRINRLGKGIDFNAIYEGTKTLTPAAFMLYAYLLVHSPAGKNRWFLGRMNILENTTLSEAEYLQAIQELIDKDYMTLVTASKKDPFYDFWERPALKDEADKKAVN